MNIYNFAGSKWEWTLEKSPSTTYPPTCRGGGYKSGNSDNHASARLSLASLYTGRDVCPRATMY